MVLIEAGNYIPADMRLVESVNLKVEEASLTGESVPVDKNANVVLDKEIPLGDRKNSAFMSTLVTYGRGRGLVTGTGMHTQIGLIAEMLQSYEDEATPLQKKLDQLAKVLGILCLSICGIIFIYGLIRDTHFGTIFSQGFMAYLTAEKKDIVELFMTAVSLAIAAVPEGLPAVVTICLALGMQRMIRRHALIRKLPAVETLGCATVICSDKTGTLTQNEMTVVQGWAGGKLFKISGEGYNPTGQFSTNGQSFRSPERSRALPCSFMRACSAMTRSWKKAARKRERNPGAWSAIPRKGPWSWPRPRPASGERARKKVLRRVQEIPFDSDRKRMTTIHQMQTAGGKFLL